MYQEQEPVIERGKQHMSTIGKEANAITVDLEYLENDDIQLPDNTDIVCRRWMCVGIFAGKMTERITVNIAACAATLIGLHLDKLNYANTIFS